RLLCIRILDSTSHSHLFFQPSLAPPHLPSFPTRRSSDLPSDSFPGLTALVTGGSPRSTGAFYDVSYDRSLSPPKVTTPYGIVGGAALCPSVVGTQVGFDEQIDVDLTRLPAAARIHPDYPPRHPTHSF